MKKKQKIQKRIAINKFFFSSKFVYLIKSAMVLIASVRTSAGIPLANNTSSNSPNTPLLIQKYLVKSYVGSLSFLMRFILILHIFSNGAKFKFLLWATSWCQNSPPSKSNIYLSTSMLAWSCDLLGVCRSNQRSGFKLIIYQIILGLYI